MILKYIILNYIILYYILLKKNIQLNSIKLYNYIKLYKTKLNYIILY